MANQMPRGAGCAAWHRVPVRGQSDEEATANLSAVNAQRPDLPWRVTASPLLEYFSRAIAETAPGALGAPSERVNLTKFAPCAPSTRNPRNKFPRRFQARTFSHGLASNRSRKARAAQSSKMAPCQPAAGAQPHFGGEPRSSKITQSGPAPPTQEASQLATNAAILRSSFLSSPILARTAVRCFWARSRASRQERLRSCTNATNVRTPPCQ